MTMNRFAALLDMPPRDVLRLVRRRLSPASPAWTADELMAASSKHRRGNRLNDTLLRWSHVTRARFGRDLADFAGRRVLEIGCGPLGGFGPAAVFLGAASVDAVDPEFDAGIFLHPRIADEYLPALHEDLVAVYGRRMDSGTFEQALRSRLTAHRTTLAAVRLTAPPDLVLSLSCLEHVFPLDSVPAALSALGGARLVQIHLVDFSNHYPTRSPFSGLYAAPPEVYFARRGKAINLARKCDVAAAFAAHGMTLDVLASCRGAMPAGETPDAWWTDRYEADDLQTHTAIFAAAGV
jgi:hypothetical protein